MFKSIDDTLDTLGGTNSVAERLGVNPSVVSSWRARGSIPIDWWCKLIALAGERGVEGLTLETLAVLHTSEVRA